MERSAEPSHRQLPHTADVGFEASAASLPAVFEEAARALAEIAAETPGIVGLPVETGPLHARDLESLAFTWLNELIALADAEGRVLVGATVSHLAPVADGWAMEGRASLVPYETPGVRALRQVKAVTLHRLAVREGPAGFTLTAYADI